LINQKRFLRKGSTDAFHRCQDKVRSRAVCKKVPGKAEGREGGKAQTLNPHTDCRKGGASFFKENFPLEVRSPTRPPKAP